MVGKAEVIAMGVVMPIVDATILGLRLASRRSRSALGVDDALAVMAFVVLLPVYIILIYGTVREGYGQHTASTIAGFTNQLPITVGSRHLSAIAQFIFTWGIGFCKLSMLFFYRRIFRGRAFNIASWLLIFITTGWIFSMFFTSVFQCGVHVEYLWGSAKEVATHCIEGEPPAISFAVLDFATDIAIILLPIYWTSKLQVFKTRKILVMTVFAFGAIAIIASLVRLIVFIELFPGHNQRTDQLGYITDIPYFEALEAGLAIIAICLPAMGGLLSERNKRRLFTWVNGLLPNRFQTVRVYTTADGPSTPPDKEASGRAAAAGKAGKAPRRMAGNFRTWPGSHPSADLDPRRCDYDELLRGENYVGVRSEVSAEPDMTELERFDKEYAIKVVTETTQQRQNR